MLKKRIGKTDKFTCDSSNTAKWYFFERDKLPYNVQTISDENIMRINSIEILNSGLYKCYGFDQKNESFFLATAQMLPIGEIKTLLLPLTLYLN